MNILHQRGELFPDEFAPKHLTLLYLLTKFWKMGKFSPMEYRGIIKNIHPCSEWPSDRLFKRDLFKKMTIRERASTLERLSACPK